LSDNNYANKLSFNAGDFCILPLYIRLFGASVISLDSPSLFRHLHGPPPLSLTTLAFFYLEPPSRSRLPSRHVLESSGIGNVAAAREEWGKSLCDGDRYPEWRRLIELHTSLTIACPSIRWKGFGIANIQRARSRWIHPAGSATGSVIGSL